MAVSNFVVKFLYRRVLSSAAAGKRPHPVMLFWSRGDATLSASDWPVLDSST